MNTEKNTLVSVIVPVYNVSKYLRRCLDSCVFQTLEDIEVIVVNDCSPDPEDANIMEDYKKMYPNKVRLVYHDQNKGLGGARNTGIQIARGDYITFVDSDDYIDVNYCQAGYEKAESTKSDIVLTWFYICQSGGTVTVNKRFGNIKDKNSLNIYPAWAMFVEKSFILKTGVLFPEKIWHEDNAVTPIWQALADRISVIGEPMYYYMKGRPDAITSLKFELRIDSIFKSYDKLFENTQKFPQYIGLMTHFFYEYVSNRLKEIEDLDSFKLFASYFRNLCMKYGLDVENADTQKKEIFGLFLKTAAVPAWEEVYEEYLKLIKKYYLSICTKKELREIFSGRKAETVCVWGCGNFGTALLGVFGEIGYECLVTDMNIHKIGKVMPNGSVVQPWNEIKDGVKTLIVGIAGKCNEISNLVDKGVEIFAVNG